MPPRMVPQRAVLELGAPSRAALGWDMLPHRRRATCLPGSRKCVPPAPRKKQTPTRALKPSCTTSWRTRQKPEVSCVRSCRQKASTRSSLSRCSISSRRQNSLTTPNTPKRSWRRRAAPRSSPAPRCAVNSLNAGCAVKRRRTHWLSAPTSRNARTPPSWCVRSCAPAWTSATAPKRTG